MAVHYAQSPVDAPKQRVETVGEVMTSGKIYTVTPDTPVIDALELIVEKKITGLPVVDENNKVIGVVSDFDLLAIDFKDESDTWIFPSLDQSWEVFHDLQSLISKSEGRVIEDVMTETPIVVRPETSINAASRLLLESKTRRLPVVDSNGSLIGLLTRRDIVTAALAGRRVFDDNLF